jgi:L-glyceraldehyde 3-phosphate reductase
MLNRWVETDLLPLLREEGVGCIAFSPLAKGLLTDRYLHGIPADSRAAGPSPFLKPENITAELRERLLELKAIAAARQQSLAQMSLAWLLRDGRVTSVLIGASRAEQVTDCVGALKNTAFSPEELRGIEAILARHADGAK